MYNINMKPFVKMLKAISSNTDPGAIACGFSCGILLGFMPKNNLLWYILMIFILFMRIQRGTYGVALLIGSLLAPLLDGVFNTAGYALLTWDSAIPLYYKMLNVPFVSFLKLHNTVVLGSFVFGVLLYIPLYCLVRLFVWFWRKHVAASVQKWKVVQAFKKIPLIQKLHNAVEVVEAVK